LTVDWGLASGNTLVSTIVKNNGTPINGTQDTNQEPSSNTHQLTMGKSFLISLAPGDVIIISALANSGGMTVAAGNGLFPLSQIQTVASITINQIA